MEEKSIEKVEEFLDKYKRLEGLIKAKYPEKGAKESPVWWFSKNKVFDQTQQTSLDICRNTRNILSHNQKLQGEFPVYPSENLIKVLDQAIMRLDDRCDAYAVCTKRQDLVCACLDDPVKPVIEIMRDKLFSYVPILDNGRLLGVFSDNALLRYIADEEIIELDGNVLFSSISEYLALDCYPERSLDFVPRNEPFCEIEMLFSRPTQEGERLNLLFVTEHGKREDKILGIISMWDVLQRS